MKIFTTAVALFVLINGYTQKSVIHDPNAQLKDIGSFTAVSVSDGIDLYLSQGNEDAIAVSAGETYYRDRIKTSVENGVLKIWYDARGMDNNTRNKKLKAYVSFKNINRLSASGASDVYVNGSIKGNELAIRLSGASDLKLKVELNKLSIDQSGASDVTISGKTSSLNIEAGGASDVNGYALETEQCIARASGASDITVTVSKELVAHASGASSISYKGNGIVKEVRSSGASSVNKKS